MITIVRCSNEFGLYITTSFEDAETGEKFAESIRTDEGLGGIDKVEVTYQTSDEEAIDTFWKVVTADIEAIEN